jgi:endo-1,4-beta-xylanase
MAVSIFSGVSAFAQKVDLENNIAKYRKGEITVKAKPGSKVEIKQVAHEFWFGCAISDGIFNGRASENDQKMYKEKFLENFNSAVTENAVKWPGMERRKGEVDYSLVDAMLNWTDENNIPLRGHNIFGELNSLFSPG